MTPLPQLSTAINDQMDAWDAWSERSYKNAGKYGWTPEAEAQTGPRPEIKWFRNVEKILSTGKPTAHISFFGAREITVTSHKGTIALSRLAIDSLGLIYHCNFLTPAERQAGFKVIELINGLYRESDATLIKTTNCITKLFLAIREWFSAKFKLGLPWTFDDCNTPREALNRPGTEEQLRTFTKQSWEECFPNTPLPQGPKVSRSASSPAKQNVIDDAFEKLAETVCRYLATREQLAQVARAV